MTIGPRDLIGPTGIAAGVIFAILLARSCNRADSLEVQLNREKEKEKLADAGVSAIGTVGQKEIDRAVEEEKKRNALLAAALEEAKGEIKAATGKPPKIVEVIRYRTKPSGVTGAPAGEDPSSPSPAVPCLVPAGATMAIDVTGLRLETSAGNVVVVGTAACLRVTPPPETKVYEGEIDGSTIRGAKLAGKEEKKDIAPRRWIAGIVGSTDGAQWGVGPSLGYAGDRLVWTLGGTFGGDSRAVGAVHIRW